MILELPNEEKQKSEIDQLLKKLLSLFNELKKDISQLNLQQNFEFKQLQNDKTIEKEIASNEHTNEKYSNLLCNYENIQSRNQ